MVINEVYGVQTAAAQAKQAAREEAAQDLEKVLTAEEEEALRQQKALEEKPAEFSDGFAQDVEAFSSSSYKERFAGVKVSPVSDSTSTLTQRLVQSATVFEVMSVMGEANKELVQLRMAANLSTGEDAQKAQAIIKKLEKLVSRGRKKIESLNGETELRGRQVKAQQGKQQRRAEELKAELRSRQQKRNSEEQAYLQEDNLSKLGGGAVPGAKGAQPKLDAAAEARIEALAQAMAAAEVAVGSGEAVPTDGDAGAAGAGNGPAMPEGGGEVAAPEGGGIDISV